MTALPILYSFRRCPFAMRARMALLVSGRSVELREILLRAKPQAMLEASPKGTVPVLVLDDGTVIDQSLDIMRWALTCSDPEGWLADDEPALIAANDGPFKQHLDRAKYPGRYDEDGVTDHRMAALALLLPLEARLRDAPYLCGEARSFTDIALFPFVRQFAGIEPDWFARQPLPHLQDWLEHLLAAPLFAAVMPKFAPWKAGHAPVMFGPSSPSPYTD